MTVTAVSSGGRRMARFPQRVKFTDLLFLAATVRPPITKWSFTKRVSRMLMPP
jgi:hypothetical protein